MNKEKFRELLNTVTVQDVSNGGIYVHGMSREELSEIVTLAGQKLGEIQDNFRVNPDWLELGPERDMTFVWHRDALPDHLK